MLILNCYMSCGDNNKCDKNLILQKWIFRDLMSNSCTDVQSTTTYTYVRLGCLVTYYIKLVTEGQISLKYIQDVLREEGEIRCDS